MMAMSRTLSLPTMATYDDVNDQSSPTKFPHTRAQLAAIVRQINPSDEVSSSFVARVVSLLDEEHEDELKTLLKATYGMDDETLEQNMLDLMHRHRDDIAGVPFLFLTPTRRPLSRPSSRTSSHSVRLGRPDTPNSAPTSPLAMVFRRPHTPATSPLGTLSSNSYISAKTGSESTHSSPILPHSSPILAHAQATQAHAQFTASLPSSPISSPRLLSAKANEFKPIPRPLSAASSNPASLAALRGETPSPDLWAHNSPRATSNLAIAAPLLPEERLLTRSLTPSSSLRRSSTHPGDDEEDPFDPFATGPPSFHSNVVVSDFDSTQWSNSSSSASLPPEDLRTFDAASHFQVPSSSPQQSVHSSTAATSEEMDAEAAAMLTDGMTPFDVLSSVFGSTLAPSELEDALATNGYEFERAMAWLVDRQAPQMPPQARPMQQPQGGGVTLVSRAGHMGGFGAAQSPRYVNGKPVTGGNRVCRYFVAGECLRADCRFSHDLERALCRFWLRGTCAKQENCEFLHHLPKDVDVSGITAAMSRTNMNGHNIGPVANPNLPPDDFPALGYDKLGGRRGGYQNDRLSHDPGRTRFAAAVKKPAPVVVPMGGNDPTIAARREAMGNSAESLHHRSAIVAPRPSPRLKLRPPSLLPTLPTGESLNSLYMAYRSRALQLGAARNACLSRAADAWRRGDGAAAKRFSREGHDLNTKMGLEMAHAAEKLVRERAQLAQGAVRGRDASWSDDPGDRIAKGIVCGGGLGVVLGIASAKEVGSQLSPEERTESLLDLHGLHSNEATEVLEEFLLSLEREHFYGLAYIVVGEEKHTGTQNVARGASRARLATGVREWVHRWGYPWIERDGVIAIDALTHA